MLIGLKEDTILCLNSLFCCIKFSINYPAIGTGFFFFLMVKHLAFIREAMQVKDEG